MENRDISFHLPKKPMIRPILPNLRSLSFRTKISFACPINRFRMYFATDTYSSRAFSTHPPNTHSTLGPSPFLPASTTMSPFRVSDRWYYCGSPLLIRRLQTTLSGRTRARRIRCGLALYSRYWMSRRSTTKAVRHMCSTRSTSLWASHIGAWRAKCECLSLVDRQVLLTHAFVDRALMSHLRAWNATRGIAGHGKVTIPVDTLNWVMASHAHAVSWLHQDTNGLGTKADILNGSKYWIVSRTKPGTAGTEGDTSSPYCFQGWEPSGEPPEGMEFEGVLLLPGSVL